MLHKRWNSNVEVAYLSETNGIGLVKKKPQVYMLPFPCNKLTPAIEKDLSASFKINLKPNLRKTMHMTIIEDNSNTLTRNSMPTWVSHKKQTSADVKIEEHVRQPNSMPKFLQGYGDLVEMNSIMKHSKVETMKPMQLSNITRR